MGDAPLYKKIGAWLQGSFTHTSTDQTDKPEARFAVNDNFAVDQASLFYGGKIYGKLGAFMQGTYDGIGRVWAWDNMDVRYADSTTVGGKQLTYGVSLNNNPGVQDLWNTTPAWAFPFDGSGLAPTPTAATLMEGGLGQIALGLSAYGMLDNTYYGEFGLYHTLAEGTVKTLTGSSDQISTSDGVAPYWRFAWQKDSGPHNFSVGTYGLYASLYPSGDKSQGADSYTDVALDAQYQYMGERDNVTARINFIQEFQDLNASFALGNSDNKRDQLRNLNASATYTYDKTLAFTTGLTEIWGKKDATLYGTTTGSPNSTSLTLQGDWLPFNKTPLKFYPWMNPRLSLQYTHYFKFDGSTNNVDGAGRSASDNDTLFLLMTLTF